MFAAPLRPLSQDCVRSMLAQARSNEPVFRNVVLHEVPSFLEYWQFEQQYRDDLPFSGQDLQGPVIEQFLTSAPLEDIFKKFVQLEGECCRIGHYQLGPCPQASGRGFYQRQLNIGELLLRLESTGGRDEKLFRFDNDSRVTFLESLGRSMH